MADAHGGGGGGGAGMDPMTDLKIILIILVVVVFFGMPVEQLLILQQKINRLLILRYPSAMDTPTVLHSIPITMSTMKVPQLI